MKVVKHSVIILTILLFCFCVGYFINLFVSNDFVFDFTISKDILLSYKTYLYAFEVFAIIGLVFAFVW